MTTHVPATWGVTGPAVTSGRAGSKRFRSRKMSTCWPFCGTSSATLCERDWLAEPTNGDGRACAGSPPGQGPVRLESGTIARGTLCVDGVNAAMADIDLQIIRESVGRERPSGTSAWTVETAKALKLEYSLRPRGRPRSIEPAEKDKAT